MSAVIKSSHSRGVVSVTTLERHYEMLFPQLENLLRSVVPLPTLIEKGGLIFAKNIMTQQLSNILYLYLEYIGYDCKKDILLDFCFDHQEPNITGVEYTSRDIDLHVSGLEYLGEDMRKRISKMTHLEVVGELFAGKTSHFYSICTFILGFEPRFNFVEQ